MPDKVVHVPGTGLMSFPGDMPNQHIGTAIQNHLQAQGQAALNQAPAPIQRLTSNLGVNFVPASGNGEAAADHSRNMNAGVVVGNPNTVEVANQRLFSQPAYAPQIAAHEAMHLIQNNLPPTLQARIPQDSPTDPYNYGGSAGLVAARAAGKTMLDMPREQQGAIVQAYQAKRQQFQSAIANKAVTPALKQDMQQFNAAHAPFINDIDKMPQSVIQMTSPGQPGINTAPRAPLPPPNWMTGAPSPAAPAQVAPPVPYAKPGPYITQLPPQQEAAFQSWVQKNHVPMENDGPKSDYDMRGYYKALMSGDPAAKQQLSGYDGTMHFPDTYKTPYHRTFSNQSMYATQGAPQWQGNRLVDRSGKVIADETPGAKKVVRPEPDWEAGDYKAHGLQAPANLMTGPR